MNYTIVAFDQVKNIKKGKLNCEKQDNHKRVYCPFTKNINPEWTANIPVHVYTNVRMNQSLSHRNNLRQDIPKEGKITTDWIRSSLCMHCASLSMHSSADHDGRAHTLRTNTTNTPQLATLASWFCFTPFVLNLGKKLRKKNYDYFSLLICTEYWTVKDLSSSVLIGFEEHSCSHIFLFF